MKEKSTLPPLVWVAFATISFVWGTTYLGIKVGVEHFPPFLLSGIRHLIAGLIFVVFFFFKGEKLPNLPTLSRLFINGCLLMVGANGLVCVAEQYISSGMASILSALAPLYIMLLSFVFFKGFRVNATILLGLSLSISGVVAISYPNLKMPNSDTFIWGIMLMTLANISWGVGTILIKKYSLDVHLYMGVGLQMLMAGFVNLILSYCLEPPININNITTEGWAALWYLIIFGSLVGYVCYMYLLKHLSPARVSIHTYLNTIVAVILGAILLNEPMNMPIFLAICVVLLGVLIVNREYSKMKNKA